MRLCHSRMLMENGRLAPSCFLWAPCLLPVPETIIQPCIFTKPGSWFQEQPLNPVSHVYDIDRTCLLYSHRLQHQLQPRSTPSSEVWVSNLTVPPLTQTPAPATSAPPHRSEVFSSVQPLLLSVSSSSLLPLFLQP